MWRPVRPSTTEHPCGRPRTMMLGDPATPKNSAPTRYVEIDSARRQHRGSLATVTRAWSRRFRLAVSWFRPRDWRSHAAPTGDVVSIAPTAMASANDRTMSRAGESPRSKAGRVSGRCRRHQRLASTAHRWPRFKSGSPSAAGEPVRPERARARSVDRPGAGRCDRASSSRCPRARRCGSATRTGRAC
jgi:hypothetical protein